MIGNNTSRLHKYKLFKYPNIFNKLWISKQNLDRILRRIEGFFKKREKRHITLSLFLSFFRNYLKGEFCFIFYFLFSLCKDNHFLLISCWNWEAFFRFTRNKRLFLIVQKNLLSANFQNQTILLIKVIIWFW